MTLQIPLLLLLSLGIGCDEDDAPGPIFDARREAMASWKQDPVELLAQCARQPFEELRITCLVQAGANLGRKGKSEKAHAVCQSIETTLWQEECHFRAGEELGQAGQTIPALEHCANAGWFGRNCLMHTAWRLPRDPELSPESAPDRVESAGKELLSGVDNALLGAGDGLEGEGHDLIMARFGYNIYVGSGSANPAPAHLDDPLGVVLRTGLAIEAARLLDPPTESREDAARLRPAAVTVEEILAIWKGERTPPVGGTLDEDQRVGRYITPILSPHEEGSPYAPIFGGGLRLVGETAEEDMIIAALEALFWLPHVSAESFLAWVDDERPRVRWTAVRLARLTPAVEVDLEAELTHLVETHIDENIRWHAADGLEHQSWQRQGPVGRKESR